MYAFAAYDLQHRAQALEAGEEIELMPMRLSEALHMIRHGQIADAKTITTLLLHDLARRPDDSVPEP